MLYNYTRTLLMGVVVISACALESLWPSQLHIWTKG